MGKIQKFVKYSRKSQAALEFIMTYGWAILVVLVAIGALAYFGVLNPDQFLPSKCTFQPGIACLDFKATAVSVAVNVQNSLGRDITVDAVQADKCTALGSQGTLANGGVAPYTLTCVIADKKYNGAVNITYTVIGFSLQHVNQGQLTTKIE